MQAHIDDVEAKAKEIAEQSYQLDHFWFDIKIYHLMACLSFQSLL